MTGGPTTPEVPDEIEGPDEDGELLSSSLAD